MTPSHIAFIMDGNGRWAERRHMPRKYGHKMGTQTLEHVVELAAKYEIRDNFSSHSIRFFVSLHRSVEKENYYF